jgi:hypothetical protein
MQWRLDCDCVGVQLTWCGRSLNSSKQGDSREQSAIIFQSAYASGNRTDELDFDSLWHKGCSMAQHRF